MNGTAYHHPPPHHAYADQHHMPPPPAPHHGYYPPPHYHPHHHPPPLMHPHAGYAPHHGHPPHYAYGPHMGHGPPSLPPPSPYAGYPQPPPPHTVLPTSSAPTSGPPATPSARDIRDGNRLPDTTGQLLPPGMKPKVTATVWEDEGTLCFQVEVDAICVARRHDNHMINGTKLLNVAGMTRGRRDGILKTEKLRKVIKVGPMHLKGVWIPYERALDFANKENITEQLYPLFLHNMDALLTQSGAGNGNYSSMVAGKGGHAKGGNSSEHVAPPRPALPQHHSVAESSGTSATQAPNSMVPHGAVPRPGIERANTHPMPPTHSSSSLGLGNAGSSYEYPGVSSAAGAGHFTDSKSMPTTPAATTPPSHRETGQHSHYSAGPSYDGRHTYPVSHMQHPPYSSSPYAYAKHEMGPPLRSVKEADEHHSFEHDRNYSYPSGSSAHTDASPHSKSSPEVAPGSSSTGMSSHTWSSQQQQPTQSSAVLPSEYASSRAGTTNGYYSQRSSATNPYPLPSAMVASTKRSREDDDDEAFAGESEAKRPRVEETSTARTRPKADPVRR